MTSDSPTPAEAEAGAEDARANLVGTLNQLRENLRPANVVDEVLSNAKVSASAISEQVWETARRNPLPALMIGAGLAMIGGVGRRVASNRRLATDVRSTTASRPSDRGFERRDGKSDVGHSLGLAGNPLATVRTAAADVVGAANEHMSAAASRGAGTVKAMLNRTSSQGVTMSNASNVRDELAASISRILDEQPLVLAAVGIAVGAAIGAAIPRTETENNLMGDKSGSVRDAAQNLLQDQYTQLRSAAGHAVEEIKQTVADHGVNADNLSGLMHDVAGKAKAGTYDVGRKLDPTNS